MKPKVIIILLIKELDKLMEDVSYLDQDLKIVEVRELFIKKCQIILIPV